MFNRKKIEQLELEVNKYKKLFERKTGAQSPSSTK